MMRCATLAERAVDSYRADLETIPPLTREEERDLVHQLRLAREQTLPAHLATYARHRLIEGNQRLVLFLARKYYRRFRRLDLEDLLQEGSLALVTASMQCPYTRERFSGYASLAIRGAFVRACAQDYAASISRDTLSALCKQGKVEEHAALYAGSLDHPLRTGEGDLLLAETVAAPPLVLPAPGEHAGEATREAARQVATLLAGLTERQQQVVRLRYGLDPTDGREWSVWEIAERLHLTETSVSETLKQALATCRRLAEQQGMPGQPERRPAPHRYEPPRNDRMARKRLEQFEKLHAAEQTVRAQEQRIAAKRLAALAHVDDRVARAYVRLHHDPAYEERVQARERQRLEEACATLQAQGQPVTLDRLVQLTSVGLKQASAFLNARAGDDLERLARAYAQLQAQGFTTIGRKRLAQAAQVSQHRAELFLREQAGAGH